MLSSYQWLLFSEKKAFESSKRAWCTLPCSSTLPAHECFKLHSYWGQGELFGHGNTIRATQVTHQNHRLGSMIQAVLDGRNSCLDSIRAEKNRLKRIQAEFTRQRFNDTTVLGAIPQKQQKTWSTRAGQNNYLRNSCYLWWFTQFSLPFTKRQQGITTSQGWVGLLATNPY